MIRSAEEGLEFYFICEAVSTKQGGELDTVKWSESYFIWKSQHLVCI